MDSIFHSSEVIRTQNQWITQLPHGVSLYLKREDLLHPEVSGNKYRKLKYSILETRESSYTGLLTFGGAHSNHIAATAAAGKLEGMDTIGIIRGEELEHATHTWSPTLRYASSCGMKLIFISRQEYRNKDSWEYRESLQKEFPQFMIIPEGGTNEFAIKGCEEIISKQEETMDFICTAVGTGGTMAGLVNASFSHQTVLGFPALKANYLLQEFSRLTTKDNWEVVNDYHFGGYAKISPELIEFMNNFFRKTEILLDPVYTSKLLFGIFDLAQKNYFPKNSRILAIHTGGLQGIEGMNRKLRQKAQPTIITQL